jgi:hypothetical protein
VYGIEWISLTNCTDSITEKKEMYQKFTLDTFIEIAQVESAITILTQPHIINALSEFLFPIHSRIIVIIQEPYKTILVDFFTLESD